VIERVASLRAGGASLRSIVEALARDGAVSRAGRALGLTQVARLAKAHATPAGEATSALRRV
jgi:hypothetical protein